MLSVGSLLTDVVDRDVVVVARALQKLRLVCNVVVGEVAAVANPARGAPAQRVGGNLQYFENKSRKRKRRTTAETTITH